MGKLHKVVFCNSPKNQWIADFGNVVGYSYQDKDINEQYREIKKSALAATRNGKAYALKIK